MCMPWCTCTQHDGVNPRLPYLREFWLLSSGCQVIFTHLTDSKNSQVPNPNADRWSSHQLKELAAAHQASSAFPWGPELDSLQSFWLLLSEHSSLGACAKKKGGGVLTSKLH